MSDFFPMKYELSSCNCSGELYSSADDRWKAYHLRNDVSVGERCSIDLDAKKFQCASFLIFSSSVARLDSSSMSFDFSLPYICISLCASTVRPSAL